MVADIRKTGIAIRRTYYWTSLSTPVGRLKLYASERRLVAVAWPTQTLRKLLPQAVEAPNHPVLKLARRQLEEYFDGRRRHFNIPLEFHGTKFQESVWSALLNIPFGKTVSYSLLAEQIDKPSAVRAVGLANGQNPLPIIVPCHRVIGKSGKLVGFGGGLEAKTLLLGLEGRNENMK